MMLPVNFTIDESVKRQFEERAAKEKLTFSTVYRILAKGFADGTIEIVARGAELATTGAGERRGDN